MSTVFKSISQTKKTQFFQILFATPAITMSLLWTVNMFIQLSQGHIENTPNAVNKQMGTLSAMLPINESVVTGYCLFVAFSLIAGTGLGKFATRKQSPAENSFIIQVPIGEEEGEEEEKVTPMPTPTPPLSP